MKSSHPASNAEAAAALLRCSSGRVAKNQHQHQHHHHSHHHHHHQQQQQTTPYRDNVSEEMQLYFSKLKELVPFMPKNKKLSKLEIIQYVIDYICELQLALESHPAARNSPNSSNSNNSNSNNESNNANSPPGCSSPSVSPSRQPLGVIAAPNTLPNTCAAQEATHLDKVPSHLDELGTRPVSC